MRWGGFSLVWLVTIAALAGAQPPVPKPVVGLVHEIGAGRILLSGGTLATIAPGAVVVSSDGQPKSVSDVKGGDLVEVYFSDASTVIKLRLLPYLRQRWPMSDFEPRQGQVIRCTWEYQGRKYPNSFRTASAVFSVAACQGVESIVAYEPRAGDSNSVIVRISGIGEEGARMLWMREIKPGEAVPVACSVLGMTTAHLQCIKPDGTPVADAECVWADPWLILRAFDSVPVPADTGAKIASQLSEALRGADLGTIAIAAPRVLGLNDAVGLEVRDLCAKALAEKFKVAGVLKETATVPPDEKLYQAARALEAKSILALQVLYAPPGIAVSAHLFTVESGEEATSFEVRP